MKWIRLCAGTVPANKEYAAVIVPANKKYALGTVPANKKYAAGTPLTRGGERGWGGLLQQRALYVGACVRQHPAQNASTQRHGHPAPTAI